MQEGLLPRWLDQARGLLSTPDLPPCSDSLFLEWWCATSKLLHSVEFIIQGVWLEKGAKREGNITEDGSREMKFSAGSSAEPWSSGRKFSSDTLINSPSVS